MISRLVVVVAIAVITDGTLAAQKQTLTDEDKAEAVRIGTKGKGALTGLSLIDTGRRLSNALVAGNHNAVTAGNGFSLRVYTPMTWVEQSASDAAKEYRTFTTSDITHEMLESVLRVIVYPDTPTSLTAKGVSGSSSAEHVVLRDAAKKMMAVQPISKEPFTDTVSSALRDMAYQGVVAKFPLDAVRELRGPNGDQEFLIVVIGAGKKEKEFRVKEKHFEHLP